MAAYGIEIAESGDKGSQFLDASTQGEGTVGKWRWLAWNALFGDECRGGAA
jgi:hypothetical protein